MEHNHLHLHNGSLLAHPRHGCGLGYAPVVYYSLLLCLGLPGECLRGRGAEPRLPRGLRRRRGEAAGLPQSCRRASAGAPAARLPAVPCG